MGRIIFIYILFYFLQYTEVKAQVVCHHCSEQINYKNIYIAFQDYLTIEKIPLNSIIYVDYQEEQDTSFLTITYDLDISEMLQSGKFTECYSKVFDFLICINYGEVVSIEDSLFLNQIIEMANKMSTKEKTVVNWREMTFTQKDTDDDNSYLYTPLIWRYKVKNSKIIRSGWIREEMYKDNYQLALKYIPEEFFEK